MTTLGLVAGLLASGAQAGSFYVVNGYTGKAVFHAAGACKSHAVYEGAVYGTVYNSSDINIGSGLVSAEGDLLAMLDEGLKVSSFQAGSGMKYSDIYYVDFSSNSTENLFEANGGCTIDKSISNPRSRLLYSADFNKGFNKVTLKYGFIGYEPMVIVEKNGDTVGKSSSFNGSITFQGSRPVF